MIKVEFTDQSVKELLSDLERYGKAQEQATIDNLHEAGLNIESGAKKRTIVDHGRLRSSIHMVSKTTNRTYSYTDNEGNTYDGTLPFRITSDLEVYVGTNVEYAGKIHKDGGTRTNARDGSNGKQFLFRASEEETPKLINRLKRQL